MHFAPFLYRTKALQCGRSAKVKFSLANGFWAGTVSPGLTTGGCAGRRVLSGAVEAGARPSTAQARKAPAFRGELKMKKMLITAALLAGLTFGAVSAQSYSEDEEDSRITAQEVSDLDVDPSEDFDVTEDVDTLELGDDEETDVEEAPTSFPQIPEMPEIPPTPSAPVGATSPQGVSTSCVGDLCRVIIDGKVYGPYRGQSVSVSSTSNNGVTRTQIYVDGKLVESF
jgi:hypothetical protein